MLHIARGHPVGICHGRRQRIAGTCRNGETAEDEAEDGDPGRLLHAVLASKHVAPHDLPDLVRGYLGDEAKTRATFPVVAGQRWAVAGDRAAWRPDGSIELHGRVAMDDLPGLLAAADVGMAMATGMPRGICTGA